jgi:NADP-dependent 3-hydroxy acid dehydrogenase YdfG
MTEHAAGAQSILGPGTVGIILGASSGIGAATARTLAKTGTTLVVASRRKGLLQSLADEIDEEGGSAVPLVLDATQEHRVKDLFTLAQTQGIVTTLVNCAAIGIASSVSTGSLNDWRAMMETNVLAMAIACREAIAAFDDARGGHIVNVSSTSGHRINPGAGFYAVTKMAVTALTEALRMEMAASGRPIKVSAISPGRVVSELFAGTEARSHEIPQLHPDQVAGLILQIFETPPGVAIGDLVVRPTLQVR